MKSSDIRTTFLDFFVLKGHLVIPSYPLIPRDDPTLLLIGAGMAPLKRYFTGERKPPHPRLASCQKCVRTPDIEQVGRTGRHATFFEMLGNFSFGDYFKEEAVAWAWELVTREYRLPEKRLWITVYEEDEETYRIWNRGIGIPEDRIVLMGKKDNFWEIGQGPCGPCSEIHYDLGPSAGCGRENCSVECDCDRYLEIWNLVFTQFNREPSGELITLKQKNIDTGAGLERLATALQGKSSFFETDLIQPIYQHFSALAGRENQTGPDTALRIVAEHSRGIAFLAADGILPANDGRGYVLRRILRRAARYGRLAGIEGSFLAGAVPLVADLMGTTYPELKERQDYIMQVIQIEEDRFQETIVQGMEILEGYIQKLKEEGMELLPGDWAFKLYDTYGFPLDLTEEILSEQGIKLDRESYQERLSEQQDRARLARSSLEQGSSACYQAAGDLTTTFSGYSKLETESKVLLILSQENTPERAGKGEEVEIILEETPFYAEAGGQLGDTGYIFSDSTLFRVTATVFTPAGQIVHRGKVEKGLIARGQEVTARVEEGRRRGICRSHTATHLLHSALKEKVGEHVKQAGSLVAPDKLRFDFTHFCALEEEELLAVEEIINTRILQNLPVQEMELTLQEAQNMGAQALFDEKYDREKVRVISAGETSKELCGGTHTSCTAELGLFRLLSEEGIGSGVRRIEAVTGFEAYRSAAGDKKRLEQAAGVLQTNPEQLEDRLRELIENQKKLEKTNQELKQRLAGQEVDRLAGQVVQVKEGINLLSAVVDADSMENLMQFIDEVKERLPSSVVVLGAVCGGKVMLTGSVSKDLVDQGLRADRLVAELARQVGGGGGGRPEMAQAGGKDPDALPGAMKSAREIVLRQLEIAGTAANPKGGRRR